MSLAHVSRTRLRPAMVLAASAVLLGACGDGESTGTAITAVRFTAADGSKTSLRAFRGTPVVVNLWATWCTPCVTEMPAFDEVATQQVSVKIIGVNVGDTAEAAKAFAADLGVTIRSTPTPTACSRLRYRRPDTPRPHSSTPPASWWKCTRVR